MRFFIVLCCLAVVNADKLGYNYQPVGHSDAGLSFAPGAAATIAQPLYEAPAANAAPSYGASSYNTPASGSVPAASVSAPVSTPVASAPASFNKEFYSFSANDADFVLPAASEQVANSLNQNLRVIFIKGPEHSGLEDAAASLAKQASEQKTAIYVLNKQADLAELANKLRTQGAHTNAKPEVHFVKYRTPEDAANAQRAIQSQYDSLGGNSQSFNGEVAPAINFASEAAAKPEPAAATPQASYLPAALFKRLRF